MPGLEELGMQTASNVANGVLGLALGGINDRRQLKQQEKLQNLQIAGSKQLTDYNFQKQMEMWKNTNYPAQMAMLKQAGLNPALIYDNGGGGASTNVATGNVSGADAPRGGQEAIQMMGLALQRQMQAAQIELTKAQTEKTKAETTAVEPGIQKTQAETSSIIQGIANQEAQERLTDMQTRITSWTDQLMSKTFNDQLRTVHVQADKLEQEITNLKTQNKLTDTEARFAEQRLKADIALKVMDSYLKSEEAKGIQQNVRESIDRMKTAFQNRLMQADQQSNENWKIENEIQAEDNAFPKELTGILEALGFGAILKGGTKRPGEIGGFHKR